uniref:DH domain-containing protein n=1 Tax=Gongylonema pulchrum TaxID=637853 RepID=A0A183DHF6_9BILA
LQLEDLLISPLQRITKLPIVLKEIHKYTQNPEDKARIEKVIENMSESLSKYMHNQRL